MNYAEIKQYDVANGPGVRVSLFVSGCTHHCKECFNPETWDFKYGKPFTEETIQTILSYMEPEYVKGITLGRMVNEWEETRELLSYIEVLVDGEFMIDKKDLGLVFRGSSNQRNILVQESLKSGKICLWTPAV